MSYTVTEQETTVTFGKSDGVVRIYSTVPAHIRAFSRDARYTNVEVGNDGIGDFGRFTIPTARYNPVRGARSVPRVLSEEQRLAASERLRKARESRG